MLPVGEDHTGKVVWEDWRASHCDPARNISPGWWYEREHACLTDFLGRVITAFADPDRLPTLRLQMMLGIAAMNDRGFVEQRVMMGTAGLEHLDGPDVVTQIRNRLVHPRGAQERVHRLGGLVAEVWLLTRHYLVLLILHSLGYQASYRDLRRTRGWAGEVGNVPWK